MRPRTLLIVVLWTLAFASVAGYAWVKLNPPGPSAGDDVEVVVDPAFQLSADGSDDGKLPVHFTAPPFALTDQNGQPFASDQLAGKAWVGFLFLTHCPTGACPVMVGKMAKLQDALPDERVHFVSFSVDPERDTPEAMLKYAREVGGAEVSPRWHLLTGESRAAMTELARKFHLVVGDDFGHSTIFLLVDADGRVRGIYGNEDPDGMAKLQADATRLLAEQPPLPTGEGGGAAAG